MLILDNYYHHLLESHLVINEHFLPSKLFRIQRASAFGAVVLQHTWLLAFVAVEQ